MRRLTWKVTAREKQQDVEEDVEHFVHSNLRLLSSFGLNTVCL